MKKFKIIYFISTMLASICVTICGANRSFSDAYYLDNLNDSLEVSLNKKVEASNESNEEESNAGLEIKMIDLKDRFGDCTLVKYNGVNILIDAGGSVSRSKDAIYDSIKDITYLDYVIFTHADSDHISNFISEDGGLNSWLKEPITIGEEQVQRKIGTLIDFDNPEKKELYSIPHGAADTSGTQEESLKNYKKYVTTKNTYKVKGQIGNIYSASELVKTKKTWFPFDNTKKNGLRILDNYYYDNWCEDVTRISPCQRNILSVSALIEADGKKALFTGDLEEFDSGTKVKETENDDPSLNNSKTYKRVYGETFFVHQNYSYLKDGVDFFKAGHHGSYTSNSATLLDVIRPKYIGISCSATVDNTCIKTAFPSQIALYNMMKWTDYIYINGMSVEDDDGNVSYAPLYGDIYYKYNNETKEELFVSSEKGLTNNKASIVNEPYFINNRVLTSNIYSLGENDESNYGITYEVKRTLGSSIDKKKYKDAIKLIKSNKKEVKFNNDNKLSTATYIKFGHIDILVNFGMDAEDTDMLFNSINKVNSLCNDKELDYLIITHNNNEAYSRLLGNNGLLNKTTIKKIHNFYHFGISNSDAAGVNKTIINILKDPLIKESTVKDVSQLKGSKITILEDIENEFELSFEFLNPVYDENSDPTSDLNILRSYSLSFIFNLEIKGKTYKYMNMGGYKNSGDLSLLKEYNPELVKNIDLFDVPTHLSSEFVEDRSLIRGYKEGFYTKAASATSGINFLFNGTLDSSKQNQPCLKVYDKLNILANRIYNAGSYQKVIEENGDVIIRIGFGALKNTKPIRVYTYGTHNIDYESLSVKSFIKERTNPSKFKADGNIMIENNN